MQPIHQMRLTGRRPDGSDEWSCPTCGRRVALRRPPDPDLTVLDPGDESAVHVGVLGHTDPAALDAAEKYGLGPIQEIPRPPRPVTPHDEDRRWLADIGIDWDGGDAAA